MFFIHIIGNHTGKENVLTLGSGNPAPIEIMYVNLVMHYAIFYNNACLNF